MLIEQNIVQILFQRWASQIMYGNGQAIAYARTEIHRPFGRRFGFRCVTGRISTPGRARGAEPPPHKTDGDRKTDVSSVMCAETSIHRHIGTSVHRYIDTWYIDTPIKHRYIDTLILQYFNNSILNLPTYSSIYLSKYQCVGLSTYRCVEK